MNINWTKFWTEQLPFCFRKVRILALIAALCAIISRLWSDWTTWGERARQRAAYTWQVFWLERLVWLEMGVVIIIEPADGRPVDFVVNVSSVEDVDTYDESRLRGLIDKYKLAGKSYRIVNSAISREIHFVDHVCQMALLAYEVRFTNHVCEQQTYIYEVRFTNHVCSGYISAINKIHWRFIPTSIGGNTTWELYVEAAFAVKSKLTVVTGRGAFTIEVGDTKSESKRFPTNQIDPTIKSITPSEDNVYQYIISN